MVKISPCEVEKMTVDSFLKKGYIPEDCKILTMPLPRSPDLPFYDTNSFYLKEYWGSYYQRKLCLYEIVDFVLFDGCVLLILKEI